MISVEDYNTILRAKTHKKRANNESIEYINYAFSFDAETSSFYEGKEKRCTMYMWGFGYGDKCLTGRKWGEFLDLLEELVKNLNLNLHRRIVVYVHNLGYDFQFFHRWLKLNKVFSIKEREPLYAVTCDGIEFRDSCLLSGVRLEKTAEMLTKHNIRKLVGDLDYDLVRHSETPISDQEMQYLINDCLVVTAYIEEQMEQYGGIAHIPYTKTGKVRKWCRSYIEHHKDKWLYRNLMQSLTLDEEEYRLCKHAYMGGFCHANPNYVGECIDNVESFDFTSSYPAVMVSEFFPMSAPERIRIRDLAHLEELRVRHNIIFNVTLYDLKSRIDYEHYISESKCLGKLLPVVEDNGRIVSAKAINITITEIDWDIIKRVYTWSKITFGKAIRFESLPLPRAFIECVYHFYEGKTTLKGVEGKEEEYQNMKEMLNSLYGMCVTDILKDLIGYDVETHEWVESTPNVDGLDEYNSYKKNKFLYYPWGVYIAAYARRNLWSGILELKNDYLYSDTDSLKVRNYEKHAAYFKKYNELIETKIQRVLRITKAEGDYKPKNNKGVEKKLGIWDREEPIKKFKTLGAKRYICYYGNKEYKITIAGLSKSYGADYLKKTYKNIQGVFDAFCDGMKIPAEWTNKKTHTYIDEEMTGYVTDYLGNKCIYHELSGIHLSDCPFKLSMSQAFRDFIFGIQTKYVN